MFPNYSRIGWIVLLIVIGLMLVSCGHQPPGENLWKMV